MARSLAVLFLLGALLVVALAKCPFLAQQQTDHMGNTIDEGDNESDAELDWGPHVLTVACGSIVDDPNNLSDDERTVLRQIARVTEDEPLLLWTCHATVVLPGAGLAKVQASHETEAQAAEKLRGVIMDVLTKHHNSTRENTEEGDVPKGDL